MQGPEGESCRLVFITVAESGLGCEYGRSSSPLAGKAFAKASPMRSVERR